MDNKSTNNQQLNELFGLGKKKKSDLEKIREKEVMYKPVSNTSSVHDLVGTDSNGAIVVSDADELKKNLTRTLGMAIGTNSVKSMANRAIKSFPIIVSDDLSADTLVMVKNMLEERYASYIDLLVSNQIINLSDFSDSTVDGGNIAIQALDSISGTDFGKERLARKARTGELSLDDIMQNNPGYQLLRTNENYVTGNPILDALLENALICDSKYADALTEAVFTEMENEMLNESSDEVLEESLFSRDQIAAMNQLSATTQDVDLKNLINEILGERSWGSIDSDDVYALLQKVEDKADKEFGVQQNGTGTGSQDPLTDSAGNDIRPTVKAALQVALKEIKHAENHAPKYKDSPQRVGDWLQSFRTTDTGARSSELAKEYTRSGMYIDKDNGIKYDKLLSPTAIIDPSSESSTRVLENSIANILTADTPVARYTKDRFEKASYLLTSRKIAGVEYISYLTVRLGLPIPERTRRDIILNFRSRDILFDGLSFMVIDDKKADTDKDHLRVSHNPYVDALQDNVARNERLVLGKVVPAVTSKLTGKDYLHIAVNGLGGAAIGGGTAAAIGAAAGVASLATPIGLAVAAGLGIAGLGTLAYKLLKNRKAKPAEELPKQHVEGWERVEDLINDMDRNQDELYAKAMEREKRLDPAKYKDYLSADEKLFNDFSSKMSKQLDAISHDSEVSVRSGAMREEVQYFYPMTEAAKERQIDLIMDLEEEIQNSPETLTELNESGSIIINTKRPGDVVVKQAKYKKKDIDSMIPMFGIKDILAYGSVEYDKKYLKDRKFNEPLILSIRFKERYSDDSRTDSELTAVIGILGVITRVPSDEMSYILQTNAEGTTIKDLFKSDGSTSLKDMVSGVIGTFMNSKQAEHLPTSGKIWSNLEKVGQLAVANSLAGRNGGNVVNAHLVFSQKEIDAVKNEIGIDYLNAKNIKQVSQLMKRYSAAAVFVCNDALSNLYSYDDPDNISWDLAPYSAYLGKSSDQLTSALAQISRSRF